MKGVLASSWVGRLALAGLFILVAFALQRMDSRLRTAELRAANQLDAFDQGRMPAETVFPQPSPVVWSGTIARTFVSGAALEITNADAPGGRFHAYMPDESVAPVTTGTVRITGTWRGWTCDYSETCVPEVDILNIERIVRK